MNIRFAKAQFLRAARLRHIVDAISEIHYGPGATSTWDGGAEQGELCFDNGCGDALAVAWDERGIVGLNFDHESELPRYQLGVADDVVPPSRAFPGVPEALLPLLREAAQWAGGEFTGAFWAVGNSSVKVAGTEDFGCWFPDPNARTISDQYDWSPQGDTPLIQAVKKSHEGVARLLLEHGADPTLSNCYEQSALHWAIRGQLKDLAATLIERGCDVRQPDSKGWTPLHSAAAEGYAELVTLLLDAGAELGAEHSGGLTALEVAQLREQGAVVALLKARK